MNKKKRLSLLLLLGGMGVVQAQGNIGIGTVEPKEAAILELQATNKGMLIPRIALNENTVLKGGKNPLSVLVFNNGLGNIKKRGFYFWSASQWELLALHSDVISEMDKVNLRIDQLKIPQLIIGNTAVPTNEVVNGKVVYIGRYTIEVASPPNTTLPYNTTIKERLSIQNISKVMEAKIYDETGELVLQNVANVSTTTSGVSFHFGMKNMYTTLPTGRYQVILKYISTVSAS